MDTKRWLKQYPATNELDSLYQKWQDKNRQLGSFSSPQQLMDFLQDGNPENFKAQDEILHSLIMECKSIAGPSVLIMYLFIILHPFLSLPFHYWRKKLSRYDIWDDEIWDVIWIGFIKILNEDSIKDRFEKIGLFFQGKMSNELEKLYVIESRYNEMEVDIFDENINGSQQIIPIPDANDGSEKSIIEMTEVLDRLVAEKIIDSIDKELIYKTRLRSGELDTVSRELGLTYSAAAKKRKRAEIEIGKKYRKNMKFRPTLRKYLSK